MESNAILEDRRDAGRSYLDRPSVGHDNAIDAPVPSSLPSIARLSLTSFRSYAALSLDLEPRPVVLTGPNGAGKTNLLEAVSFLSPGRGLRHARLSDVERQVAGHSDVVGTDAVDPGPALGAPWAVAAEIRTADGTRLIGTGRDPQSAPGPREEALAGRKGGGQTGAGGRRVVRIDGAPARSQQALGELLRLVWLTPRMDGLFRAGGSERRRFLDRLVFAIEPEHAGRLNAYEHALRERSRLLKEGRRDDAWLTALEHELAEFGVAVAAARRLLVDRLSAVGETVPGAFPKAELDLAGEVDRWLENRPALAVEDDLRMRLRDERRIDAEAGGARSGPHRSDLLVRHQQSGLAAGLCSTGEQKALLIAIVLAHARLIALDRGAAPILLLDEVIAHLDERRRRALFEDLVSLGAQAWMTGTDSDPFSPLDGRAQIFRVQDGTVTPL